MRHPRLALVAFALLASGLGGCFGGNPHVDVAATFYPIEFLAQRVAGPNLTVLGIVKAGAEPHDYEPSARDLRTIHDAKALVVQGAGFERWIQTAQRHAPHTRLVTATDGLDLRLNPDDDAGDPPQDPHTWLDPVLAQAMTRNIQRGLAAAWPDHAHEFEANADRLVGDLRALDAAFQAGLTGCGTPFIITNHGAFGYLAARYAFTMIPISGLDPNQEPTAKTIEHVVEEARAHNVTVIFFEDHVSHPVADTIVRELQRRGLPAQLRVLSPIEFPPETGDFLTAMQQDLANLREAMRCP